MNRYTIANRLKKQVEKFGNVPKMWYHNILTDAALTDYKAIAVLSWLTEKYIENKFEGEWLKVTHQDLIEELNLTDKQVTDTLNRLENNGYIIRIHERTCNNGCWNTDLWVIPCTKKMYKAAQRKIHRRQRHIKRHYTNFELCSLVAKKLKTPVHKFIEQNSRIIQSTKEYKDISLNIPKDRGLRRQYLMNLFFVYKGNYSIQLAILNSYPWLKKYIIEEMSAYKIKSKQEPIRFNKFEEIKRNTTLTTATEQDIEAAFRILWSVSFNKLGEEYYQDQLYASYPTLVRVVELGLKHDKTPEWVAESILRDRIEVDKLYSIHTHKKASWTHVSYWLNDCADIIVRRLDNKLVPKSFWER